jgi:hypothetical protein
MIFLHSFPAWEANSGKYQKQTNIQSCSDQIGRTVETAPTKTKSASAD